MCRIVSGVTAATSAHAAVNDVAVKRQISSRHHQVFLITDSITAEPFNPCAHHKFVDSLVLLFKASLLLLSLYLKPMSHLQFYRATLSRDKIASVTWRAAQLLNSRAAAFLIRAALYSVQLCRENAVNADWSVLVYATKLQCATRRVTLAILSRDKVARQTRAMKLQV